MLGSNRIDGSALSFHLSGNWSIQRALLWLGRLPFFRRKHKNMRSTTTYLKCLGSHRRRSEQAIPAVLRHVGITVEELRIALVTLALLVVLLIVLLIGG